MTQTLTLRFLFTVTLTLILTIIPLPEAIRVFRPSWVLLFVLYIQFFMPNYFRITWVFLIGLSLDVLLSSVIGEHGFALLLTSWLAASKMRRFHFFSIAQQMALIAFFSLIYQFVIVLIDSSLGFSASFLYASIGSIITMMFWPWLKLLACNFLI